MTEAETRTLLDQVDPKRLRRDLYHLAQAAIDEKPQGLQYTVEAGRWLADLMVRLNRTFDLGLTQYVSRRERPGDDDGSFVNAGYGAALMNGGGAYPYYHREDDTPDKVDVDGVARIAQVTAAAVLAIDRHGAFA